MRHDTKAWGYLRFDTPSTAALSWVTLSGGGSNSFYHGASLVLLGFNGAGSPMVPMAKVNHVTISGSAGMGALLDSQASFQAGSSDLTITGSGSAADPRPLGLQLRALNTLPSGVYTGNLKDEIWVDSNGYVTNSVTMHDPGVPYWIYASHDNTPTIAQIDAALSPPVLTIDPGVRLRMAPATELWIGLYGSSPAALNAVGTTAQPILFTSAADTPAAGDWVGIRFGSTTPALNQLQHVTIEYAGSGSAYHGASVALLGGNTPGPLVPVAKVVSVAIKHSGGLGAFLDTQAAFADGSTDLTITSSGNATDPRPVGMEFRALGSLPSGSYTGNLKDEIWVDSDGYVTTSVTMHQVGVPYWIYAQHDNQPTIAQVNAGQPAPVLTIEAGVRLRMAPATELVVGFGQDVNTLGSPASMIAIGTAAQPIVFTSAANVPAPGDWVGIHFGGTGGPPNQVDHASIEYAGGDPLINGFSCTPGPSQNSAVLIYSWKPGQEFITNSAILHSSGHGILRGWVDGGPDFLPTNTFDVAGCKQTLPRQTGGCPASPPCP